MSTEENKYVVLMETNGKEYESWYYFLKYNGNEEALQHLSDQIESVDFYIMDDLSTFDIDLKHLVSERTAKEMTKVELNAMMFHRKFDGKLEKIDLGFSRKDSNDKKIVKCFKKLGIGKIEDYIDEEDIDPEDLVEGDVSSESSTDYEYNISSEDDSSEDEKKKDNKKERRDKRKEKREIEESSSEDEKEDVRRKKDKFGKKKK